MAIDSTREVRRAGMARLAAFAPLNALVPAARVFSQVVEKPPEWPFVKWGAPSAEPRKASCLDGAIITVAVHAYAKERRAGGARVETAEDHASRIGEKIAAALDEFSASIAGGVVTFFWQGSSLLADGGRRYRVSNRSTIPSPLLYELISATRARG